MGNASRRAALIFAAILLAALAPVASGEPPSGSAASATFPSTGAPVQVFTADSAWAYTAPFFTSSSYNPAIPTPEAFLGFDLGSRPVHHDELWRYLEAIDRASERVAMAEDGATYEGRRLGHLVVTSPENHARLEQIRGDIARLGDPRTTGSGDADALVDRTPAVCWFGFSIHGDELSGVDAAAGLAYELAASQDTSVQRLLRNLVVLIDPCENPDGRERFLTQTTQWRTAVPNPDYRALQHAGTWPWGRGNHYLFDLNRDWLMMAHPETRGRVRTMVAWNPQLVVDVHEMSGLDTYLFSPPREPYNPNMTAFHRKWGDRFARDQAAAFDQRGWSYYSGEWNEEWYPGYGSSRARYTGAVGILYEEAGVNGSMVKQPDGNVLTYRETVHHQLISTLANLTTAANHRAELLREFRHERSLAVDSGGEGPVRVFYFVPGTAADRAARLARLLRDQGIEVGVLRKDASVGGLHDLWGNKPATRTLPAGTYVVSLSQPMGVLAHAILEFDPRMNQGFLESERRELEARNDSRLYEVTAWSLPMAFGVEAYWGGGAAPEAEALADATTAEGSAGAPEAGGRVVNQGARYGYVIDGSFDTSLRALAFLLQNGARVRVAQKAFRVEGQAYPRGSLLLRRHDNDARLDTLVTRAAARTGLLVRGVSTAKGDGPPDLGGGEFRLMIEPRVAIFAGPPLDFTSFGSAWWVLDQDLSLRASPLDVNELDDVDLSKYNVIVFPPSWGGAEAVRRALGDAGTAKLRTWVDGGGTLITLGEASAFAADSTSRLSQVRERGQALAEIESYRRDLEREVAARAPVVDSVWVWEGGVPTAGGSQGTPSSMPPGGASSEKAPNGSPGAAPGLEKRPTDLKTLEEEDRRGRLFRPHGVILRADLDREHWLTAGLSEHLPVIISSASAYLSRRPIETAVRLAPAASLRMSGLLWPEARERLADSAYLTREPKGKGQIILFAGNPQFRAQFRGSMRLLENAILMGPGFGTLRAAPW